MKPQVCVLRTDGTNCDKETALAFEIAGGEPQFVHVNQLRNHEKRLKDFQILVIPGGFTYGDDVASGKILSVEILTFLRDQIQEFVEAEKLIIGICNGFQILTQSGLLPFGELGEKQATLAQNNSGRFECRWVDLVVEESSCVFTRGMSGVVSFQAAHGEGRFYADRSVIQKLEDQNQVVLRYARNGASTMGYPENPNGSLEAIAGICDPTGKIFGLMPHPERIIRSVQHPNWRKGNVRPHGFTIFQNAVDYFL